MARRARKNANGFTWTGPRILAARLVAEDEISDQEIAEKVGVHVGTLERWKLAPEFKARVEEIIKTLGDRCLKYAIARRHRRVANLQDRLERMQQVIAERAADSRMADVAGGKSGLLVIEDSEIRMEEDAEGNKKPVAVPVKVAVDTGLLKELREHEKQAAIEARQWTEKHEHTGAGGSPLLPAPKVLTREQFNALSDEERLLYLRGQLAVEVAGGEA